ncbi:MAG: hypothetical protein IAF08_15825 [Rhizobacter sp.]|nr:hypothetical protein [Chlorobiales bacterium]
MKVALYNSTTKNKKIQMGYFSIRLMRGTKIETTARHGISSRQEKQINMARVENPINQPLLISKSKTTHTTNRALSVTTFFTLNRL